MSQKESPQAVNSKYKLKFWFDLLFQFKIQFMPSFCSVFGVERIGLYFSILASIIGLHQKLFGTFALKSTSCQKPWRIPFNRSFQVISSNLNFEPFQFQQSKIPWKHFPNWVLKLFLETDSSKQIFSIPSGSSLKWHFPRKLQYEFLEHFHLYSNSHDPQSFPPQFLIVFQNLLDHQLLQFPDFGFSYWFLGSQPISNEYANELKCSGNLIILNFHDTPLLEDFMS